MTEGRGGLECSGPITGKGGKVDRHQNIRHQAPAVSISVYVCCLNLARMRSYNRAGTRVLDVLCVAKFWGSILMRVKCSVGAGTLYKRLFETCANGPREPGGGIHATSKREICTAEYTCPT